VRRRCRESAVTNSAGKLRQLNRIRGTTNVYRGDPKVTSRQ
jgi:hypothetical protein